MTELLLRNGKVATPFGIVDADLLVQDGKITAVSRSSLLHAEHTLDVAGKYVLPGVIDPHTELGFDGEPSTLAEALRSETPSMVTGGVTSFITHFRGQVPYGGLLRGVLDAIEGNSMANVGVRPLIKLPEHVEEIPMMVHEFGITDFKFYPGPHTELFRGAWGVDDGLVYKGFGAIAAFGYPGVAVAHCENWILIAAITKSLITKGRSGQVAWSDARPNVAEEDMIARMILYAKHTRCPLYILHVTTAEGVGAIAAARREGYDVIGETLPVFLAYSKFDQLDPVGKHFPPLRSPEDVSAMWRALNEGVISAIGSDHAPGRWKAKLPSADNIWVGGGTSDAGAGVILPVMLTEGVSKGRTTLERLVEVCSLNPAKAFGLYPAKGALLPGSDADLVVVDPRREVLLKPEALHLSTDYSRFEGMRCRGWPVMTVVGGEIVAEEGNLVGRPGLGGYLRRTVNGSAGPGVPRCH